MIDKLISIFLKKSNYNAVITLVEQGYVPNDKINWLLCYFTDKYEKEWLATSEWGHYRYMVSNLSKHCKRRDILEKLFKVYLKKSDINECKELLTQLRRDFTCNEVIQLTQQYARSAMSGDSTEERLLELAQVARCETTCIQLINEKRERWANDLY